MNIYQNRIKSKEIEFRKALYSGAFFLETDIQAHKKLCSYAQECIYEIFGKDEDVFTIHERMPVEEFVDRTKKLKGLYTNSKTSMELIRESVTEIGEDPANYIFQQPRIRVIPDYDYLHVGMSYAYRPHRDTWYGGVDSQINAWMPVFPIQPDEGMWLSPGYFERPVKNTSSEWSVKEWVEVSRWKAAEDTKTETRIHPVPVEEIDPLSTISIAGDVGDCLFFSGTHLHGSLPTHQGNIRFSTDYRIIHKGDLRDRLGAPNVDNACPDMDHSCEDFFDVATLQPFKR